VSVHLTPAEFTVLYVIAQREPDGMQVLTVSAAHRALQEAGLLYINEKVPSLDPRVGCTGEGLRVAKELARGD